jgi:hypothetical protein
VAVLNANFVETAPAFTLTTKPFQVNALDSKSKNAPQRGTGFGLERIHIDAYLST